MKERPIIFNSEMVRAILDGRKTQTRRVVKGVNRMNWLKGASNHVVHCVDSCPYGQVGDRIWVRETWFNQKEAYEKSKKLVSKWKYGKSSLEESKYPDIMYQADYVGKKMLCKWKPSIHMPRWASRITLEIKDVRVERLQEISEEDAIEEGIPNAAYAINPIWSFESLWDSIHKKENTWEDNPWVWVIEFKRIRG